MTSEDVTLLEARLAASGRDLLGSSQEREPA
jgi:hypothetical protein